MQWCDVHSLLYRILLEVELNNQTARRTRSIIKVTIGKGHGRFIICAIRLYEYDEINDLHLVIGYGFSLVTDEDPLRRSTL